MAHVLLQERAAPVPPHPEDAAVLEELIRLTRETYLLWDEDWVGFSWRNYTHDHVRRVRNLAMHLCLEEGGDTRPLDLAATLHDITKSYDGEIIMKDGKRVIDEKGLWHNEFLPPARRNHVTDLYDQLGLRGLVHNTSGARIADALLTEYGYPQALRDHVQEIIITHLTVSEQSSLEGRCLYDADTIDANIGYPAFYRNIQISMHNMERQYAARGASLDAFLTDSLQEYLEPYVREKLPAWVEGKRRDFVGKMTTAAGKRRAEVRLDRLGAEMVRMSEELDTLEAALEAGRLAPAVYFMRNRRNPSVSADLATLMERWPTEEAAAAQFLASLHRESAGVW
ncbi:MAG TPA: HD domain-containing protein [Chloroflexota bacterium]|nr:HD domain-containing protein [Chloroflexota bacterium]